MIAGHKKLLAAKKRGTGCRGGVAMNERAACQLARAFADVFASRRRRYECACVSVEAVRALTAQPKYPDAYVSKDADTTVVRELLKCGFRWVRTEWELAIFEKEVPR